MLGPGNEEAALEALHAFPGGFHVGGGITPENAKKYIEAGASHIIVTSYVFQDGKINFENLQDLVDAVGSDRIVLDLSCRRKPEEPHGNFYVVTDKWQKYTDFPLTQENLELLSRSCQEFLVHGVDVEGKQQGIQKDLVKDLGSWSPIPVTYAGGVRSLEDVQLVNELGEGKVDVTIGSALDIFGGSLPYKSVVEYFQSS